MGIGRARSHEQSRGGGHAICEASNFPPPPRLRPVIEALEPRAMLAGVGPESWSAGGIGTPLMGAGALLTSGTILTCSSPTPGSSGTASLPGSTGGSGGTASGGVLWLPSTAGSGAGTSSSGSAGTVNTNGPALSSQLAGGSGGSQSAPAAASGSGGFSVVLFDSAQPSRAGLGNAPGSTGSNTLTLEEGVPPPRLTPLVFHPGSDDGPGFVSTVWTGDEGGVQFVLAAEQEKTQASQPLPIGKPGQLVFIVSGAQPGSQVPYRGTTTTTTPVDGGSLVPPSGGASYSVFSAVGGLLNVIGGACQAAVGVNVVIAASAATVATEGGASPLTVPIAIGGSVVVVHGLDQVWAGVTTIYTGQTQRPYTAQALDPLTGNETTSDWANAGVSLGFSGWAGYLSRGAQVAGQVANKGDEIASAVGTLADDGANAGATALNTAANSKAQFSHIDFGGYHTLTAGQGTKLRFTVSGEKMWVDMWEATNSTLKRQGIGGRSLFEEALRRFPDVREIRGIAELDNLAAFRATGDVNKTPFAVSLRKLGFTRFEAIEVSGDIVLIAGR